MKLKLIRITILATMFLVACNDDKDEVTTAPESAPTEQDDTNTSTNTNTNTTTNSTTTTDAPFNFSSFSLDVDFPGMETYEVDYDNEATGVEASIKDDRNYVKLTGDDAYSQLERLFKQFTFDATTPNEEVIEEVLTLFSIADDYQSVEIEVRFADGAEKEYNIRK